MEGFTGKATDKTFTCSGKFRLLFLNPTKQYTYPTLSTFKNNFGHLQFHK